MQSTVNSAFQTPNTYTQFAVHLRHLMYEDENPALETEKFAGIMGDGACLSALPARCAWTDGQRVVSCSLRSAAGLGGLLAAGLGGLQLHVPPPLVVRGRHCGLGAVAPSVAVHAPPAHRTAAAV